ncbi:MAG: DHH family phosphoesterase [Candidatus Thermoplasmatota archaeon]|nr:DHH family phosphoesterase [Candidatus Thermoplasmatota archaeon]
MGSTDLISSVPSGLWSSAERAGEALRSCNRVVVAAHIDADGISSAAIAQLALGRSGIKSSLEFFKKLDGPAIEKLSGQNADVTWFADLGSGSLSKIEGMKAVVTDHHMPDPTLGARNKCGQTALTDFSTVVHVNPQLHGISGANELSGAGSTFLAALALDPHNIDLAHLAVLGAIGDLQDQKTRRLEGLNRTLLSAAIEEKTIEAVEDIRYFGRETRPIHKLLEFSSDPFVPRISGNEEGALGFLLELGIELKDDDRWRTWVDLTNSEKKTIVDALKDLLRESRRRPETIERLVGEVYVLKKEQKGTPVRDAKEFATLLNACGRHGKADVGLKICAGDRGEAMSEGMVLLRDHRSALSKALSWAKGSGIIRLKNIQFFDAGDEIEETIVGTVAGMLLGSEGADRSAPMVAFAESTEYSDTPKVKASSRGTQDLVARGLDLSVAIRKAAEKVGGVGGGHNIAAGATIPADKRDEFLSGLDEIVGSQITSRGQQRG